MDLSEIQRAIRSGLKPLEATAPMRLSAWAAEHFYLSAESSYVEKHWDAYPYQVAILDAMGDDDIQEVTLLKSARVGYTKMLLAAIAYFAEHRRRNQALWQPTDEDSDEFVKTELEPMIRDVPVMAKVFPAFMRKSKSNTLRQKSFLGSMLHLRGGKAAKNYRRLSVSVAILDEVDGFDLDVEGEGSPVELARKRIEGATFPKLIIGSTPKIKDESQVEAREQQAQLRFRFHVPCPHCGTEQVLRWGGPDKPYGFKWTGDDEETVAHLCEHCHALFTQAEYLSVWHLGRYIAQNGTFIGPDGSYYDAVGVKIPKPISVAFSVWTAYSPQADWSSLVRLWLSAIRKKAAGDKSELKTFVNTTLGETWEEEVEKTDQHELKKRADRAPFPLRTVPLGGLVLVAGVDVQDNRFAIVVWAFGRGEEMWTVDHIELEANPALESDWDKLDAYLRTPVQARRRRIVDDRGGGRRHRWPLHTPGLQLLPDAPRAEDFRRPRRPEVRQPGQGSRLGAGRELPRQDHQIWREAVARRNGHGQGSAARPARGARVGARVRPLLERTLGRLLRPAHRRGAPKGQDAPGRGPSLGEDPSAKRDARLHGVRAVCVAHARPAQVHAAHVGPACRRSAAAHHRHLRCRGLRRST
jgi:phage terminase large subunit GpA-like protein